MCPLGKTLFDQLTHFFDQLFGHVLEDFVSAFEKQGLKVVSLLMQLVYSLLDILRNTRNRQLTREH